MRRTLEFCFSGLCLLICLVFFIPLLPLLLLVQGWPIFFKQTRIGKNRKPFQIYKIRTMVNNAEELKVLLINKNEANFPFFKMAEDPRITPLGRILRKLSIDELPQLWNVLKGEMSIVGPRPVLPSEAEQLADEHFMVRPGLTGPTQIYRTKKLTLEETNKLEEEFIKSTNWLQRDLFIILKTFLVVFKGE